MCTFCYLNKSDCIAPALKVLTHSNKNVHRYQTHNKKLPKISKHTNAQNNCSFLVKSAMSYIQMKHIIKRK